MITKPGWMVLAVLGLAASSSAQFSATGQFGPYTAPPYGYDDLFGEWINFETELLDPILYLSSSALVAVANDADDRVVFLNPNPLSPVAEVVVGQGPCALAKNPGADELWVSVRQQSSVVVVDLATFRVTAVLRPPVPASPTDPDAVGARAASAPAGIAFAQGKAFVAATDSDQLVVYDASTKAYVTSIDLKKSFNGGQAWLNDPFAVVAQGSKVYVASRLSGNNTTARIAGGIDFDEPPFNKGNLGPDQVSVVDLDLDPSVDMADYDVAVVDPVTNAVTNMISGVGTTLLGAAGHAQLNRLLVANMEARNGAFVGEAAFPSGRVVFNRLTSIDLTSLAVTTSDTEIPATAANIVMPTDIEVTSGGRFYVAGYSSSNIGVWSPAGVFEGAITTPAGPRGVAVANGLSLLFSYNRAAGSVTSYDISGAPTVPTSALSTFALTDPTYDRVKSGRVEFLKPNSGAGTANCMSCHVDARLDGIAWNLSKTLSASPAPPPAVNEFRDRKGVMVTQDLRGLSGSAPYHWRGEQKDLDDFRGAFKNLLKGTEPTLAEFALMKDYMLSLEFPPNPHQGMNRVFSQTAKDGFDLPSSNVDFAFICNKCHAVPLGTNCDITLAIPGDEAGGDALETPALRGLWVRSSPKSDINPADDGNPATLGDEELVSALGFGFAHEGVVDDVPMFLAQFFGGSLPTTSDRARVAAFVDQLDSSLAPAATDSEMLNSATLASGVADKIPQFLMPQADARNCDLAARGTLNGTAIGLYYLPTPTSLFVADDQLTSYTWSQLSTLAQGGQLSAVFLGTPRGSGERIGVDRDRDGYYDRKEVALGTNPSNPDTDGDGRWDSYDGSPLSPGGMVTVDPPVVVGNVTVVYETTNSVKLTYETDSFSPTIVEFREHNTVPWLYTTGDGVLTTGPGTSNRWKRRHTAFLRPAPTNNPPLTALKPDKRYDFRILTQGQNNVTWASAAFDTMTEANVGDSFRATSITPTQVVNNGNGTFSYTVEVQFEATQGTPTMLNLSVPGRFTFYNTAGRFKFTNMSAPILAGNIATFVGTSPVNYQVTGNRITFDIPMWCNTAIPPATPVLVSFPGDWSDGPNMKEMTAQ